MRLKRIGQSAELPCRPFNRGGHHPWKTAPPESFLLLLYSSTPSLALPFAEFSSKSAQTSMLLEVDPNREVLGWFSEIKQLLESVN